tara:strand:+ start:122 stop:592 length:471 start_codon:yes stop_codon:yes gene_type:complete
MYKKFILLIVLFNLISHCGFTPLYVNQKNVNFTIVSIKFTGDKTINKFLKSRLYQFQKDKKDNKEFTINVNTKYEKNILTKDKTAKTTNYELSFIALFEISSNGQIIKILKISDTEIMNNINDDFEEQTNERIAKQNFASSTSKKIATELLILNDN